MDAWIPELLQTADSIFPTGAYAHSFGLEGAVQEGVVSDPKSLHTFVEKHAVPQLETQELPIARLAFEAAAAGDEARVREVDALAGALKLSAELRAASANVGGQKLSNLAAIYGDRFPLLAQLNDARRAGEFDAHAAVVSGVFGAVSGQPVEVTLAAIYYQSVSALTVAALKLIRIGQLGCQKLVAEFQERCPDVVAAAMEIPENEVGAFTPLVDIVSDRHERAFSRLFIS